VPGSVGNIATSGNAQRFAVIQGFQFCQLVGMLVDQIGDFPEHLGALLTAHIRPGPHFKSRAGSMNRPRDVFFTCQGYPSQFFSRCRVAGDDSFPIQSLHPFSIDQQLLGS
jgi:hypothetical protein